MKLILAKKNKTKPITTTPASDSGLKPTNKQYANLKEVMDYKRDFSIFYSGVEYEMYLRGCYDMGVRNFLMSYHYIKDKNIGDVSAMFDEKVHLFIDSGAHTYQNDPKYQDCTVEFWEKHLQDYLRWAERNKDSIFAIASFDYENLVGGEVVKEWNRKYLEPFMLRTGIPVCFVWHQSSVDDWDYYCKRYPYTGFSAVNTEGESIEFEEFRQILKTAEKHNSVVHGFGMTQTSKLPDLPFYTVDSTSWKSGFRYGQVAVWNGKKVQMFKKDDWDTKILPVLRSYPDITFDETKLKEFYEPEILRANVYAYMRAEEYIIDRLKALAYWKKAKATKVDLDNVPPDYFPSVQWFEDYQGLPATDYAQRLNINPEIPSLIDLLYDATAFCNWDKPEYASMRTWYEAEEQTPLIDEMHDRFINRIVPDKQAKLADLVVFYRSCVSGENDTLLQMGTNFDRIVKERDSYIEDDEDELVDVPPEQIRELVKGLLPSPSDEEHEISELDEEIFKKANIVPVFDENGKFVKGQVVHHRPKKVYSKKFPKFACDTCYAAAKCPEFKAGFVCAYQKMFNRFDTRDMTDIIQSMQGMANHNLTRMQRAMVIETINGTVDPNVTAFIDQNMRLLGMLKQMYDCGSPEVLKQTTIVRADGSQEQTTQITNPQGGGILEKIFGGLAPQPREEKDAEVIDVEAKPMNDRYKIDPDELE